MIKLDNKDFKKIAHLVKSQNELSVFSVIIGVNPGEIYVNNIDNPTVALIQTSECNLITGSPDDEKFNSEVSSELDFWDQITPDSNDWIDKIPTIHPNSFIRRYKRRQYVLSSNNFIECNSILRGGYVLEKVDLSLLRKNLFENSVKVLEWVEEWGDDKRFEKYGTGYLIRNDKAIVSWSLSDCSFEKKIAIGIHTDNRYRKNGFGKIVTSATIKECISKGYREIQWLCVDSNKGSRSIAEKLGFRCNNIYDCFSSYPPIENVKDLSENQWHEWGEYLEEASKTQKCLLMECLKAYAKSNDVKKTIDIMMIMNKEKIAINYLKFNNYIMSFQLEGVGSNFTKEAWTSFINGNIHCID